MGLRIAGLPLLLLLLLGACTAVPKAPALAAVRLDFLVEARTSPEQCIALLGPPSREFAVGEGGCLLTWRLGEDGEGLHPLPTPGAWYDYGRRVSLVLLFDAGGRLTRHTLVRAAGG